MCLLPPVAGFPLNQFGFHHFEGETALSSDRGWAAVWRRFISALQYSGDRVARTSDGQ
jgi:hypothetical protein